MGLTLTELAQRQPAILLVDDHASIRLILKAGLEANGFHVLTTATGEEALEICRDYDGALDICLTDLGLTPHGADNPTPLIPNGLVLMEQARSLRPNMKMLLFSGHSDERLRSYGIVLEEGQVIRKPCGLSTLLALLRDALGAQAVS